MCGENGMIPAEDSGPADKSRRCEPPALVRTDRERLRQFGVNILFYNPPGSHPLIPPPCCFQHYFGTNFSKFPTSPQASRR